MFSQEFWQVKWKRQKRFVNALLVVITQDVGKSNGKDIFEFLMQSMLCSVRFLANQVVEPFRNF